MSQVKITENGHSFYKLVLRRSFEGILPDNLKIDFTKLLQVDSMPTFTGLERPKAHAAPATRR